MKAHWQVVISTVLGVALGGTAMVVHGHMGGGGHGGHGHGPDRDLLSLSGSPAQLAERSERLTAHVCEVIAATPDCALSPLAAQASIDLRALQPAHRDARQALHQALVGAASTAADFEAAQSAQLALVEQSSRRYLRFLNEAATQLSAEQKQRFAQASGGHGAAGH